MNTAEYLIEKLNNLGITDFFGLPGDYNFNILHTIQNNPDTRWIGCTNELNAGYAADGYARERGYGALVTTYGVGELSALNAIAGSYAENVSVINIVGTPALKYIEDRTLIHHNFSQPNPYAYYEAYKQVTEAAAFLNRDNAKLEIDRVLKIFINERKPVYIAIPEDVALMDISEREVNYYTKSNLDTLKIVTEKIADKIKRAENPIILGDSLVKRFNATVEYQNFVEKSGIPTTNFLMGTGLVNPDLKNYIGTYFAEYGNPTAKKYLETTDCLIAVGTIYSDTNSSGFKLPYKINSQTAIYGTYTYIDGIKYEDVKMTDVLKGLADLLEEKDYKIAKPEIGYESLAPEGILTSYYIYPRLQDFLSEKDIVVAETGSITHGICQIKLPANTRLHTQLLWCSIGWATPAAFGACIANPDKKLVLITGDGAHQISAMEIGNMLRYGIKPVIIVINNKGYTIERMLSNNPQNEFNDIVQINYSKFARIFEGDAWSTKTETADDFDKALKVTSIMNKLCYIEAVIDSADTSEMTKTIYSKQVETEKTDKNIKTQKKKEKPAKPKGPEFATKVHESLHVEE